MVSTHIVDFSWQKKAIMNVFYKYLVYTHSNKPSGEVCNDLLLLKNDSETH